jgi:hypothetical protein
LVDDRAQNRAGAPALEPQFRTAVYDLATGRARYAWLGARAGPVSVWNSDGPPTWSADGGELAYSRFTTTATSPNWTGEGRAVIVDARTGGERWRSPEGDWSNALFMPTGGRLVGERYAPGRRSGIWTVKPGAPPQQVCGTEGIDVQMESFHAWMCDGSSLLWSGTGRPVSCP